MKQRTEKGPAIVIIIILIYLLIPLVVSIIYSMFSNWTGIVPQGFTLQTYVDLFQDKAFLMSLGRTILIAIIPIVLTILLVLLALFVTVIYFPKLEKYVQIICMIPYTIQGVILSVSILALYVANPTFLSNRIIMLIGAYCIIIFPYIYQGIRNGMRAVNMPLLPSSDTTISSMQLQ